MEKRPIEYHLEVYENSFINDPSISWTTSSPFQTLSVGDYFDHRLYDRWHDKPRQGQRFKIKEINHIMWEIEENHIGHKLMVCVQTVEGEIA